MGSPIYEVMTSQIKGLGVETIGPITTDYERPHEKWEGLTQAVMNTVKMVSRDISGWQTERCSW